MRTETIEYDADGLHMVGQLYHDETKAGPRPGVLVFPEAFGLGEHAKGKAQRIAALGYVALACDLHGGGKTFDDLGAVMPLIGPLMADPSRTRARASAALDILAARAEVASDKIAAIGYCFGGTMSLELARGGYGVAGVVGFHSGLKTARPEETTRVAPKVLVCIGADDPGIPPEQRLAFEEEMRRAGADCQIHVYGGVVHSFTNPEADKLGKPEFLRYDATADARSWQSMCAFFDEIFAA